MGLHALLQLREALRHLLDIQIVALPHRLVGAAGYLAERTLQEGYEWRVVAGHCCSLAAVDDMMAARTIELVARARISVVTLPASNLYLPGADQHM
jgi:cytosine deaminase